MRSEFEKLPEIKKRLISVKFNEVLNRYESKNSTLIECLEVAIFLNGALYAYQEQQKQIDAVLNIIAQSELHCDRSVFGLQDEIKELLK